MHGESLVEWSPGWTIARSSWPGGSMCQAGGRQTGGAAALGRGGGGPAARCVKLGAGRLEVRLPWAAMDGEAVSLGADGPLRYSRWLQRPDSEKAAAVRIVSVMKATYLYYKAQGAYIYYTRLEVQGKET